MGNIRAGPGNSNLLVGAMGHAWSSAVLTQKGLPDVPSISVRLLIRFGKGGYKFVAHVPKARRLYCDSGLMLVSFYVFGHNPQCLSSRPVVGKLAR